jgi:hypothetical protein
MRKSHAISCFAIALIGSVVSTQAMAIGKGFYVHMGSGSADWTADFDIGQTRDFDSDTSHLGVGFVLDTATDGDRLFNYRFQVGYEQFKSDSSSQLANWEMGSLVVDQDFGFGIVRNDNLRFWIGPELRISISADSKDNLDMALIGFGIGPAIGINFHTSDSVSLGLKGGYMIMNYGGAGDDTSVFDNNIEYSVDENFLFFNFAVLWR